MANAILDWLAIVFGYVTVQNNGAPVAGSPGERTLNFTNPASIVDNALNGSTDITFPSGSTSPTILVSVSTSGTSTLYTRERVDVSGGTVTRTLPSGVPAGARVTYKIVKGPVDGSHKLTIDAPGGGTIEKLMEETGGIGMVMASSTSFALAGDLGGSPVTWEADGANNWEIV